MPISEGKLKRLRTHAINLRGSLELADISDEKFCAEALEVIEDIFTEDVINDLVVLANGAGASQSYITGIRSFSLLATYGGDDYVLIYKTGKVSCITMYILDGEISTGLGTLFRIKLDTMSAPVAILRVNVAGLAYQHKESIRNLRSVVEAVIDKYCPG